MNDFCLGCEDRDDCEGMCVDLESYIERMETGLIEGVTFSTNYIDRTTPDQEEDPIEKEKKAREARKSRGKAIRNLIRHFANLTDEEGKSLKYFLIFQMAIEEKLKHWEIAEIIGFSRVRVTQILNEIKAEIN